MFSLGCRVTSPGTACLAAACAWGPSPSRASRSWSGHGCRKWLFISCNRTATWAVRSPSPKVRPCSHVLPFCGASVVNHLLWQSHRLQILLTPGIDTEWETTALWWVAYSPAFFKRHVQAGQCTCQLVKTNKQARKQETVNWEYLKSLSGFTLTKEKAYRGLNSKVWRKSWAYLNLISKSASEESASDLLSLQVWAHANRELGIPWMWTPFVASLSWCAWVVLCYCDTWAQAHLLDSVLTQGLVPIKAENGVPDFFF